jgi:hypothetical protein
MSPRYLLLAVATYLCLVSAHPMDDQPMAGARTSWRSDVHMFLLREGDGASLPLEGANVELTAQKVVIKPKDRIEDLLRAKGIYPDAEAFGAIYALNPSLDASSPHPGLELLMPHLVVDESVQEAFDERYLVALTLDVGLKRGILTKAETLSGLAHDFGALVPRRFEDGAARSEILSTVDDSVDFMRSLSIIIRERSRPLSYEMLWQTNREAQLLASILADVLAGDRAVTRYNKERIDLIAENMQIRFANLKGIRGPGEPPQRFPQVNVIVKTLDIHGRSEVHGLRVFYVPRALFGMEGTEKPFLKVSSPTKTWLPVANYRLWVGTPDDSKPISDILDMQVRKQPEGDSMLVELIVHNEE